MKAQDLKNSILQLAIQGKLVEQNPNDEPASVLLEKIKAEKEKLIKEKKIKKEKALPEISEEEKHFEIPQSWEWVRLGELSDIYSGNSINKNIKEKKYMGIKEGYPYIATKDVDSSIKVIDYNNGVRIPYTEEKFRVAKSESILICAEGGSAGKKIGLLTKDVCFGNKLINFNGFIQEINKYIYYLFQSVEFYQQFVADMTGIIGGISINKFKNLPIALPPLEEQKRIVAKIEEVLEKIEEYDKVEKELAQLEKLFPQDMKKSILQYAIKGKLVEQNPNDETASVLLEKIKAEKEKLIKEKKIKREKPLPEISEEEKKYELPSGWQWVRIGDVAQLNPRNKIDDDIETSFIPMKLIEDGYSNIHTMEIRKWKDIKSGFTHFAENDVVLAKITPCFQNRKSAIMKNLINGVGAGTTELYVLRPYGEYVLSEFLLYLVKSYDFIEGGVKTYTGTAGQQRVKKEYVENYVFALPPIEEQRRIVTELDKGFETITRLEEKMDNSNSINKVVQFKSIEQNKKELVNN